MHDAIAIQQLIAKSTDHSGRAFGKARNEKTQDKQKLKE
jgi:hypothetical protein